MTSSVQGVFFPCRDMCRHLLDIHKIYLSKYSTMPEFTSDYAPCRDLLLKRLREPAPGRIQLLTGPRQVGKTTLLLEIAAKFGDAAVYADGDKPDAALPGFWECRRADAEVHARRATTVLLLDEIHYLDDWAKFGTTCVERPFQSTSSQRAHPHCG